MMLKCILLKNFKIPTIAGILIFMSRVNFMLREKNIFEKIIKKIPFTKFRSQHKKSSAYARVINIGLEFTLEAGNGL